MIWWIIFIAVIEGLTEFLPVSSTGHLIVVSRMAGIEATDFWKSFEIAIQLGAVLSVGVLYAKRLLNNIGSWGKIIMAFIPTGIIGLAAYGFVKDFLLGNVGLTIVMLFLGGVLIIVLERGNWNRNVTVTSWEKMTYRQAVAVGIIQTMSLFPGVSRAAATILGASRLGFSREAAVEFSFLLALPTMAAATGWDLVKSGGEFTLQEWAWLGTGMLIAFISARIAVVWLLRYVRNNSFEIFGWYRIGLAIIAGILIYGIN